MKLCTHKTPCALSSVVAALAADRDEDREQQNARAWRHIQSHAERSGDGLHYDGPLSFL